MRALLVALLPFICRKPFTFVRLLHLIGEASEKDAMRPRGSAFEDPRKEPGEVLAGKLHCLSRFEGGDFRRQPIPEVDRREVAFLALEVPRKDLAERHQLCGELLERGARRLA